MISMNILPVLDTVNVSSVQISTLHAFCLSYLFCASKPKGDSDFKTFIENQLPVKRYQIDGFTKYLPPKMGRLVFLLSCAMLDSSNFSITKSTNLE